MQEVFKKIIEKLEDKRKTAKQLIMENPQDELDRIQTQTAEDFASAYKDAIEIVKQEAEKYQSSECGFISKSEVLRFIEEIKCNDDIPKNYGTLLDIMRGIRNMPTVDNNGWIPCIERIPKYGEVVMCCCENCGITVSCITHKGVKPSKSVRFGQHSVIAWQPVPQSY